MSAPSSTKLKVERLSKRFGTFVALSEASFEVNEGEFFSLLGPSGSGKTTILMLISGVLKPSAGDIWIDGKHCNNVSPDRRDIGVVFQNYALFPHMTVYENVAFPLRMRKLSSNEIARSVDDILGVVQLEEFADRLPRNLSGGQQQRVAFARAAVYRPSIIVMDEPLGALDRKLREQMQDEIRNLHRKLGTTIIYVTHDQEEALTLSDRICVMERANIEQIGTPTQVYHQPATPFVADFLGESNTIEGTVEAAGSKYLEVRTVGSVIKAPALRGVSAGEKVKVVVRPERLHVGRNGQSGHNCVSAGIEDVIFLGSHFRVITRTTCGARLVAKCPVDADQQLLKVGTSVPLAWLPAHSKTFAA